jgi:DNA repair exonuclease SbcCD ATPase subunit
MKKKVTINQIYNIFKKYGDIGIKVNTPYGYKKI